MGNEAAFQVVPSLKRQNKKIESKPSSGLKSPLKKIDANRIHERSELSDTALQRETACLLVGHQEKEVLGSDDY